MSEELKRDIYWDLEPRSLNPCFGGIWYLRMKKDELVKALKES